MSRASKLVGQEMTHPQLGKVKVTGVKEGSRTVVLVECIDRGAGWNEQKQAYTGIKIKNGWMRGQNHQFGHKDEVHFNTLT